MEKMRKIVVVNQKGGCGKTTTAINLACSLAAKGKKVLLVDMDPQGHAGLGLGIQTDRSQKTIYEVLSGRIALQEAIHSVRKNLAIIPSNVVLSALEQLLAGRQDREFHLAKQLSGLEATYDFLIIDCPPSVGLLTFNALLAADEAIIPVDASPFSLHGLDKLLETFELIREKTAHAIAYRVIPSNIDQRTSFGRSVIKKLSKRFGTNCSSAIINTCTHLREAAALGKPIMDFDKRCAASRDFMKLTEEIIRRKPAAAAEKKPRPVTFKLKAPKSALVQIAGDFTNWRPEKLELKENGAGPVWQIVKRLGHGTYQYKYLVDGRWINDPSNGKTHENCFGNENSVISV